MSGDVYVDESVLASILAGVLVLAGIGWAWWGANWVRRVELRAAAEPLLREFGLSLQAEGMRPHISASGRVGPNEVEIRVSTPADRPRYRVRIGRSRWVDLDRNQPATALRSRLDN